MKRLKEAARAFMQKYNEKGQELPDPTPVEVPFKWRRPLDIHEMIARAVQSQEIQRKWSEQGLESWDEANDFDVEDEEEFNSPYELKEMQDEWYNSDRRNVAAKRREDGRKGNARREAESEAGTGGAKGSGKAAEVAGGSRSEDDGPGKEGNRAAGKAA